MALRSHLLRWEHIKFRRASGQATPSSILIAIPSTKTRRTTAANPTWQAIGRLRHGHAAFCPVRALKLLHDHLNPSPKDTLFTNPSTLKPLSRSSFIFHLRRLIRLTAQHFNLQIDPRDFGGRSFRRGSLSELAKHTNVRRVAAQADHASLESANVYVQDTIEARAANSRMIAQGFQ